MNNKFDLLKSREIIDILIGDKSFNDNGITIQMPYLSGPTICGISNVFGFVQNYTFGTSNGFSNLSRWQYMTNLMNYCIKENKMSDLLSHLTAKDKFKGMLKELDADSIQMQYNYILNKIFNQINSILYFGGNKLQIIGSNFYVTKLDEEVKIETPHIKVINRKYIVDLKERAFKDIKENNFDSALTKARTLLEEVFIYVIELNNEKPKAKGDINKLYKQVKGFYNMHQSKEADVRINMMLSGLEKIISSISEMRNLYSDSHGAGNKRIEIDSNQARLFVNASTILGDYILSLAEEQSGLI